MRNDFYPSDTVSALLQTDYVTTQTKEVLRKRLDKLVVTEPAFFSKEEFRTLQAVCKRLLPQPVDRAKMIDLAGILDTNLADSYSNGWRYDTMPPDKEAYRQGLKGIEDASQNLHAKPFYQLEENKQDEILSAIQQKTVTGKIWEMLPADLFFEELLASLVEIYYSHPVGKEEIGDVTIADAQGWKKTQLNSLETQEPEAIKINSK